MKKTFNMIYYIGFVAILWLMNRHFQNFVAVNGVLLGLLVGLVLAFLAMLVFKTITKVLMGLIIIAGIVVFLFSVEFLVLPAWAYEIWSLLPMVRNLLNFG